MCNRPIKQTFSVHVTVMLLTNFSRFGISTGTLANDATQQCYNTIGAGIQYCSHEDSSSNWAVFWAPEVPFPVPRQIGRYPAVHAREDLSANHSRSCTSQLLHLTSSASTSWWFCAGTQRADSAANLCICWQPATDLHCSRRQAQSYSAVLVIMLIFSGVFTDCFFIDIAAYQ